MLEQEERRTNFFICFPPDVFCPSVLFQTQKASKLMSGDIQETYRSESLSLIGGRQRGSEEGNCQNCVVITVMMAAPERSVAMATC